MSSSVLSGNDTAVINGRLLNDLADISPVELTYPNDIAAVKTGKNGNSIYSLNETGRQAEVLVRVLRNSGDDKFLQGLMNTQLNDFASFVLMNGVFVKRLGDGRGSVGSDTYTLSGGVFIKRIPAKMNVEGDTEQSVAIYTMRFSNAPRVET